MPDLALEREATGVVAGIDEAGRGPWAGPVVAAAVILDVPALGRELQRAINDSKQLARRERERLYAALWAVALIGIGAASAREVDRANVLGATFRAMTRALGALGVTPDLALVDGDRAPPLPCPVRAIVRGDARSLSIAAASIIAKVTRDRIMAKLACRYPGFGWERNVGYGTAEHQAALGRLGPTPHHRLSFGPVGRVLLGSS